MQLKKFKYQNKIPSANKKQSTIFRANELDQTQKVSLWTKRNFEPLGEWVKVTLGTFA